MNESETYVRGTPLDAIVIGAGFGGLHMLHTLRQLGFDSLAIEAASDVGGTWFCNRYPGARCDVESLVYSYSFSPELDAEWRWSERYAGQKEIQAYLRFASERLDLRRDIRFNLRVVKASFDDDEVWTIETNTGGIYRARFCIMATGPVSIPAIPDIAGIGDFEGDMYHSAHWPEVEPDFTGKRVGVLGTGSSGTQLIPVVAQSAERLFVLLRTPNFTVPARNGPLTDEQYEAFSAQRSDIRAAMWRGEIAGVGDVHMPEERRLTRTTLAAEFTPEKRQEILEYRWSVGGAVLQGAFKDVMLDEAVNSEVADFVRGKIKESVNDPLVAEKLIPKGYALGTKRICVGTNYYETFNRDNVELVDVKAAPIERFTATGVVTGGREIALDVLISATGFDALTGALTGIDLTGSGGLSIKDAWADGPHTYLGLMVEHFPNMFMIGGPGSPSVFSNVVMTNEYQVQFIGDLLSSMRRDGHTKVQIGHQDQEEWTDRVNETVKHTLLANADSWYVGANIPGKPRVILAFTGGVVAYRAICDEVRNNDFKGFARSSTEKGERSVG